MPKILITNAYSARNKGDAGIIAGMVGDLRSRDAFREARFTISSTAGPEEENVQSLKTRLSADTRLQALGFLVFLYPLTLVWIACRRFLGFDLPVWSPLHRMLRAFDRADLVVAAGGGYLYTQSRRKGNTVLLTVISNYHSAVLLGKPVYLFSQSIGPFAARFQERLAARSLRKVRMVFARESGTQHRLEGWARKRRMAVVHPSADAAFLISDAVTPPDLPQPPAAGIRVGLTVRRWFRDPARQQGYEQTFGRFAGWLAREMNAVVFFVPQVTWAEGGDDDRTAARNALAHAGNTERIHLIEEEPGPARIRGLCGGMDYFVGTRMHSNIYALSMKVPVLAVGYQPKTAGIMTQLGLERFVLPIEGLRLEEMQEGFRRLLEERSDIVAALDAGIPRMRDNAQRASRLIEEDFTA